jgi:hypothetical protein
MKAYANYGGRVFAHFHYAWFNTGPFATMISPPLSLDDDSPAGRALEPSEAGNIVALPRLGGLHHRYTRRAA